MTPSVKVVHSRLRQQSMNKLCNLVSVQLLADDHSATEIKVRKGITMSKIAQRELRPELEHRFCKTTSYMYSFADENRMKLLAASMVMMFLFDGKIGH